MGYELETVLKEVKEILSSLCKGGIVKETDFELRSDVPLSSLTSFQTGGPCVSLFPLNEKAFIHAYGALREKDVPLFVLGGGTNVIARDEGYQGVILSTLKLKGVRVSGHEIEAEAGVPLTFLSSAAQKNALTGLEFAYGIPGSVGGGVFMNAGAYEGECKDVVKEVRALFPDGTLRTLSGEALGFGYRSSVFQQNGAVVLSAVFSLRQGEKSAVKAKMTELMGRRKDKQPLEYPSAGSTFKRCEGRFTARLIDQNGLKGKRIGGAQVSEKHAGFIINAGEATGGDIFALIELVKETIRQNEGIQIECEVRTIE